MRTRLTFDADMRLCIERLSLCRKAAQDRLWVAIAEQRSVVAPGSPFDQRFDVAAVALAAMPIGSRRRVSELTKAPPPVAITP